MTAGQMKEYLASTLDVLPAAAGRSDLRRRLRQPILILLAATGLILLLACLNVANLSLAKALARRRATALRVTLGASRQRILAEQLVENGLLALAGCAAGVLLAPLVSRTILSFLPVGAAGVALRPDVGFRVLGFALAVTALAALVSGTAPALFAASTQPAAALKREWRRWREAWGSGRCSSSASSLSRSSFSSAPASSPAPWAPSASRDRATPTQPADVPARSPEQRL